MLIQSAMMPCRLPFRTIHGERYVTLFKHGDDLRQDQLILQMITLMDKVSYCCCLSCCCVCCFWWWWPWRTVIFIFVLVWFFSTFHDFSPCCPQLNIRALQITNYKHHSFISSDFFLDLFWHFFSPYVDLNIRCFKTECLYEKLNISEMFLPVEIHCSESPTQHYDHPPSFSSSY